MTGLSHDARAILDAARRESAPTDADRERLRSSLAVIVGPLPMPKAQPVSAGAAASMSVTMKIGLAGVALFVAGIGAASLLQRQVSAGQQAGAVQAIKVVDPVPSATPPPSQPAPVVVAPAPPVSPLEKPAEPEAVREPPRSRPARPSLTRSPVFAPMDLTEEAKAPEPAKPAPTAPTAPLAPPANPESPRTTSALADELALVREAQVAARAGNPSKALQLLDDHARRFPRGTLREERIAARVHALCALGRRGEASEEAETFLAETPQSPYASRVRDSCAGGR
jgi:hypothetical protein